MAHATISGGPGSVSIKGGPGRAEISDE
jgi:hypothetical protein